MSIAEIGRMDVAAKALGYSQPAISYQIKCLETNLKARLFTREPGGAKLTADGRMLLPSARAVVTLFDSIRQISGNTEPAKQQARAAAEHLVERASSAGTPPAGKRVP
ncbi:LysR family transcriptional regulator [Amycolatopsis aidingensis]|uniref:LysR family transcriptional regulator n=1 Tax=Amycolatopsis aidingensis TaxID=2842453 RepID=UPI001E4D973C